MNSINRTYAFIFSVVICCATSFPALGQAADTGASGSQPTITLSLCIVSLIDDVTLAAQEEGVVREIGVAEGTLVRKDGVVARQDERHAEVQLLIAEAQLDVAAKKSGNDVDIRLAKAEAEVKSFEHANALKANRLVADVVGQVEIKRLVLAHKEAELKAEKAARDLDVLVEERDVRELEITAARLAIDRRTIRSPFDGVVVQRFVDQGEWLKVGDPICRVIRLDKLWVEGFLEAKRHRPDQVDGRAVAVAVELAGDKVEKLAGKIVFVDPQIDGNGRFRVRATVENRRDGRSWLLMPGHTAEMVVDTSSKP